jgi:L-ascorbate metabolism protein UlaG (beta-lactamase superfamily)
MDLQYFGGNCIRIATKKANVIIDDTLKQLGGKGIAKSGDIALFTQEAFAGDVPKEAFVVSSPGEYEVHDVSIKGIPARLHVDTEGKRGTMYRVIIDDVTFAVVGHIYPDLSDDQLEALGMVDVLIVPVGGHGYTLDAVGAAKLIKKIEPKMVIPTHYAGSDLTYEVPQATLEEALKELALEPQTVDKLKLKADTLPEKLSLVVLEKQ